MVKHRASLTVHDTRLNGNRLDLNVAINVITEDFGNDRANEIAAYNLAVSEFKRMGFTQAGVIDLLTDPDMWISWDIVLIDSNVITA
jgi:hypothetical protein